MALDLSALDTTASSEKGAVLELLHPTSGAVLTQSDGSKVTITLAGEDSERYRRATRASIDRRLKAQQSGRRLQLYAEEMENDAIERLVAVTISWSGIGMGEGDLPFSADAARALYRKLPWVREQAEAFVLDRANFLKASPST